MVSLGVGVVAVAIGATAWYVQAMSADRLVGAASVPATPVGLVLGAELYADGQPSPYLQARLDLAHDLFVAHKVQVLLVSGDNSAASNHEADGMRAYLISRGVPAAKVVVDPEGVDTFASCVRAREVFGVTRTILVSQSYHLPRALTICRGVGVEAWGVGDETVKERQEMWIVGTAREYVANLKMLGDLLTYRHSDSPPRSRAVTEALKAP